MDTNFTMQREAITKLFNLGMSEDGGKVPAVATGRMTIAGLAVAVKHYGPYMAGKLAVLAGISARDAVKAALIARQYLKFTYSKENHHGSERPQDRSQQEAPVGTALQGREPSVG